MDDATVYRQRSGDLVLPRNVDWWDGTKELRERFDFQLQEQTTPAAGS